MFDVNGYRHTQKLINKINDARFSLTELSTHMHKLLKTPPSSINLASLTQYQQIHQACIYYYQQHIYSKKSWWAKVKNWWGFIATDEKQFLSVLKLIQERKQLHEKKHQQLWQENTLVAWITDRFMVKGKPKAYRTGIFQNNRTYRKIKILTHRLMGNKDYSNYPDFQGLPRDLAAHKIKRELEKFTTNYPLSFTQKQQIQRSVTEINTFLKLNQQIIMQHYFKKMQDHFFGMYEDKSNEGARLNDLHWSVYELLMNLPVGQNLIIPHGYKIINKTGHACLVVFYKTTANDFDIHFINTGTGAWDHLDETSNDPQQINYGYVPGRSMQEIIQDQLIENLFEPLLHPKLDIETACAAMTAPMIQYNQQGLLQKKSIPIPFPTNATCSHTSWQALLALTFGLKLFTLFELFVTKKALSKLHKIQQLLNDPDLAALQKDGEMHVQTINTKLTNLVSGSKTSVAKKTKHEQKHKFFHTSPSKNENELIKEIQKQLTVY